MAKFFSTLKIFPQIAPVIHPKKVPTNRINAIGLSNAITSDGEQVAKSEKRMITQPNRINPLASVFPKVSLSRNPIYVKIVSIISATIM